MQWAERYNLASIHTRSLCLLVYRRYKKDNVVVVELFPQGFSLLAASNETTPRRNRPSRLDSESVGNNS